MRENIIPGWIQDFPQVILENSDIAPTNIFEIGASNGNDSEFMRNHFNIPPENVFCFEPNPSNVRDLTEWHPNFNIFPVAVSDFTGKKTFQCHIHASDVSSFRKLLNTNHNYPGLSEQNYTEHEVDVLRMDYIINHYDIKNIDVCKIDVEGNSYEVLQGFGDKLNIVKFLHVEAEKEVYFDNQPWLFIDVKNFLTEKGYAMVKYYDIGDVQCDTWWVRNDVLKTK